MLNSEAKTQLHFASKYFNWTVSVTFLNTFAASYLNTQQH